MRTFLVVFLVALSILVFSYDRNLRMDLYLNPDGSAFVTLHEEIYKDDLVKIYAMHQSDIDKYKDLRKEFFKDISKGFYYLYGSAPDPSSIHIKGYNAGSKFVRDIYFKLPGLIKFDEKYEAFTFSRKHFESEDDMLGFFEEFLDGKIAESAFVSSYRMKRLETKKEFVIYLPKGSVKPELMPIFSKKPMESWKKDYGKGNTLSGHIEIERVKEGYVIYVEEIETTGEEAPEVLLSDKNVDFFQTLRDIGTFDVIFMNKDMNPDKLTRPVPYNPKWDFSKSWTYNLSINASKKFCDGPTCLTPGMEIGTNFIVEIKWYHHWKKVSWWRWKYVFDWFEGKITINPYAQVYVNLHAASARNKSWSYDLISKDKWFTFWVSGTPVVIVLEGKVTAKASLGVSGTIDVNASTRFDTNAWVKFRYQNGWSKYYGKSYSYSGVNFSANANLNAYAKGELPTSFSGYIYDIAGPYIRLTPWLKGQTYVQGGTSGNQVGYSVTGGLKLDGGVQMAGWLKSLCGNIGSVSYTIWSKTWTLKSGTYTF
jgi:hypothetical protein